MLDADNFPYEVRIRAEALRGDRLKSVAGWIREHIGEFRAEARPKDDGYWHIVYAFAHINAAMLFKLRFG